MKLNIRYSLFLLLSVCFLLLVSFASPSKAQTGTTIDLMVPWKAPTQRENGVTLPFEEISHFDIRYRKLGDGPWTNITVIKSANSYIFKGLAKSSYEFQIATVDTNGLYSNYVTLNHFLPNPPKPPEFGKIKDLTVGSATSNLK